MGQVVKQARRVCSEEHRAQPDDGDRDLEVLRERARLYAAGGREAQEARIARRAGSLARSCAAAMFAVGVLVLLGWLFGIGVLRSLHPSLVSMKANTAVCFVLAGWALWLELPGEAAGGRRRRIARSFATLVALGGAASLVESFFGWDLGIDELLFHDATTIGTSAPGRMAPATAFEFIVLGAALLTIDVRTSSGKRPAQGLALIAFLVALLPGVGYLYGVTPLYAVAGYTTIALHTVVGLLLFSTGVLLARPREGLVAPLLDDTDGARFARRLLPAVVAVPIVLGWLGLLGQRAGLYGSEFGVSLSVLGSVACLGSLVAWAAAKLVRLEAQRWRALSGLAASEGNLATTLQSIGDAVIATDATGRVIRMNPEAERLTGWKAEDARGRPLQDVFRVVDEQTHAGVESPVARVLREGKVVGLANHSLLIGKGGEERPIADSGAPIRSESGEISGVVLVFRDQTEERAARRALSESEGRYRTLAQSLPHLVWTCQADGPCDYLSPQWVAYTGIPEADQLGYRWLEQLHPDDRERVIAEWNATAPRGGLFDIEFRIRRADGAYRWFKTRAIPFCDGDGRVIKWFGSNTDIDDHKRSEEALRESEERHRTTLYSIGDGMIATDATGAVTRLNPVAEALTGWTEQEARGRPVTEVFRVVNEETRAEVESPVARVLRDGIVVGLANHTLLIAKDGSEHPIADSGAPVRNESGETTGVVLVFRDQTEERASERALEESERRYHFLFDNMLDGFAYCRMVFDQGRPVDFTYLEVNDRFAALTGLTDVVGKNVSEVIAGIRESDPELFEIYGRVASTGVSEQFESLVAALGIWFSVAVYSPKRGTFVAVFQVVTERKRAEQALRASEAKYRMVFENCSDAILVADTETRKFRYANPAATRMFGYSESELCSIGVPDLHPTDSLPGVLAEFEAQARGDKALAAEVPCRRKDGTVVFADINSTVSIMDGLPVIAGFFRDVSERKREKDLQRLTRDVLDVLNRQEAPIPSVLGLIKDATGIEALGVRLKSGEEFPYVESRGFPEHFVQVESDLCARDGSGRILSDSHGGPVLDCMCGTVIRRRTDTKRPFFTEGGSFWTNSTTGLLASATEDDRQALTRNRCNGEGYESVALIPLRAADETIGLLQLNDHRRDQFTPEMVRFLEGLATSLGSALARSRAEAARQASEHRFRSLFHGSRDALMTLAPPSWQVESCNPAAVEMYGARDEADLMSRAPWELSPARQPDGQVSTEAFRGLIDRALGQGSQYFEWTSARLSGAAFPATVLLTRVVIEDRVLLQATVRDETEKRRLEANVAQADRLASMGMLAAGVAHEINNPLSYVLFNVESLGDSLPKIAAAAKRCCAALREQVGDAAFTSIAGEHGEALHPAELQDAIDLAREAVGGAHRIKDIARGLGAFSRVEPTDLSRIDLRYPIESAINMAYNEIKYRALLVKDFGAVPSVLASEGKLAQVFLNLLINATHAIDEGQADRNRISVRTFTDGDDVCAEVADTGKGIAAENLPRIFDAFFTTKGIGKGSGLGLAICRNIVTEFGGSIDVESQVGKGTRFLIRLPVKSTVLEARAEQSAREEAPSPVIRGRILVVDDEAAIRASMARLLGREHEVVTAGSGTEAQAILGADSSFDLILCDLMMPEMTGMDLHEWLARRDPALGAKVVFVTGGAFTPRASEYLASVGNIRIEKPFDGANLRKLVSRLVLAGQAKP